MNLDGLWCSTGNPAVLSAWHTSYYFYTQAQQAPGFVYQEALRAPPTASGAAHACWDAIDSNAATTGIAKPPHPVRIWTWGGGGDCTSFELSERTFAATYGTYRRPFAGHEGVSSVCVDRGTTATLYAGEAFLGTSATFVGPGCWNGTWWAQSVVPFHVQSIRIDKTASAGVDETVTAGTWGRRVHHDVTFQSHPIGMFEDEVARWGLDTIGRAGLESPMLTPFAVLNSYQSFPHEALSPTGAPGSGSVIEHSGPWESVYDDPDCITHTSNSGLPTALTNFRACPVTGLPILNPL